MVPLLKYLVNVLAVSRGDYTRSWSPNRAKNSPCSFLQHQRRDQNFDLQSSGVRPIRLRPVVIRNPEIALLRERDGRGQRRYAKSSNVRVIIVPASMVGVPNCKHSEILSVWVPSVGPPRFMDPSRFITTRPR